MIRSAIDLKATAILPVAYLNLGEFRRFNPMNPNHSPMIIDRSTVGHFGSQSTINGL